MRATVIAVALLAGCAPRPAWRLEQEVRMAWTVSPLDRALLYPGCAPGTECEAPCVVSVERDDGGDSQVQRRREWLDEAGRVQRTVYSGGRSVLVVAHVERDGEALSARILSSYRGDAPLEATIAQMLEPRDGDGARWASVDRVVERRTARGVETIRDEGIGGSPQRRHERIEWGDGMEQLGQYISTTESVATRAVVLDGSRRTARVRQDHVRLERRFQSRSERFDEEGRLSQDGEGSTYEYARDGTLRAVLRPPSEPWSASIRYDRDAVSTTRDDGTCVSRAHVLPDGTCIREECRGHTVATTWNANGDFVAASLNHSPAYPLASVERDDEGRATALWTPSMETSLERSPDGSPLLERELDPPIDVMRRWSYDAHGRLVRSEVVVRTSLPRQRRIFDPPSGTRRSVATYAYSQSCPTDLGSRFVEPDHASRLDSPWSLEP